MGAFFLTWMYISIGLHRSLIKNNRLVTASIVKTATVVQSLCFTLEARHCIRVSSFLPFSFVCMRRN